MNKQSYSKVPQHLLSSQYSCQSCFGTVVIMDRQKTNFHINKASQISTIISFKMDSTTTQRNMQGWMQVFGNIHKLMRSVLVSSPSRLVSHTLK